MRRRLLAWLTGLALSGALLAPTAALAAQTETIHVSDSDSFAHVNPCSGATGTLTVAFSGVLHITTLDNGTVHVSDGSLLKMHVLYHRTVNANGTVTSSIETEKLTCP